MTQRRIDETIVESGVSGSIPFAKRPEGGKLFANLARGDSLIATKIAGERHANETRRQWIHRPR